MLVSAHARALQITRICVQALALCLLGFATLDHNPGESVLAAVQQRVGAYATQFDTQAVANCLWALALLHALPPPTWNALITAFLGMLGPDQSLSGEQSQHFISCKQVASAVQLRACNNGRE